MGWRVAYTYLAAIPCWVSVLMQSVSNVNGQKSFLIFFILGCQVGHVISDDIMVSSTQYDKRM